MSNSHYVCTLVLKDRDAQRYFIQRGLDDSERFEDFLLRRLSRSLQREQALELEAAEASQAAGTPPPSIPQSVAIAPVTLTPAVKRKEREHETDVHDPTPDQLQSFITDLIAERVELSDSPHVMFDIQSFKKLLTNSLREKLGLNASAAAKYITNHYKLKELRQYITSTNPSLKFKKSMLMTLTAPEWSGLVSDSVPTQEFMTQDLRFHFKVTSAFFGGKIRDMASILPQVAKSETENDSTTETPASPAPNASIQVPIAPVAPVIQAPMIQAPVTPVTPTPVSIFTTTTRHVPEPVVHTQPMIVQHHVQSLSQRLGDDESGQSEDDGECSSEDEE
jgi:hypothetical protein